MTTAGRCPSEQQLAAFVDGALADHERVAVVEHVDQCSACFDLVATLGARSGAPLPAVDPALRNEGLRRSRRSRVARRLLPAIAAAAAVVLAVVWLRMAPPELTGASQNPGAASSSTRGASADATRSADDRGAIVVEEPRDGDAIDGQPLVRWHGPNEATSYEVQMTTAGGDLVVKRQVQASQHELRLEVSPNHSGICYVWVAAYLPEGRRITSNVVKVTLSGRR